MTIEEAEKQYNEYLEGHIGNVNEALDIIHSLDIPFVNDNYDKLKSICQAHDASKYSEEEYTPYREHFYPINDEEKLKTESFEQACRHHIKNNKHHWDYWLNDDNELDIPDENEYKLYCVERCCDWLAMANQHDESSLEWYNANKDSITMPDYGWELCDEIMSKVPEKCNLSFDGVRGELDESDLLHKLKPQIEDDTSDKKAVAYYKNRILKGDYRPILIGSNNEVIDGNHTMIAYQELNMEPKNVYIGTSQDFLKTAAEIINTKNSKNPGLDAVYKMIEDGKAVLVESSETDLRNKIISLKGKAYLDGIDKKSKGHAGYYALSRIVNSLEKEHSEKVSKQSDTSISKDEYIKVMKDIEKEKNHPKYYTRRDGTKMIRNDAGGYEELDEEFKVVKGVKGYLLEASMSQLKHKTLSEDPTRAKKSKHVQSKYIGISKYGVLNFETTSETHSGVKWYQEIHFPSFTGFMNIVESGDEIEPADVKKAMSSDNIKISCDDPSFLYWAWKYKAWRDVYGLEKETRAPQRNNVHLVGALCKHLYSVIELLNENRIVELIARDLNQFCKMKLGIKDNGYQDSEGMLNKELKANQYDYNIEDVMKDLLTPENYQKYMGGTPLEDLGLSDKEMADIDNAIKGMRSASQYSLKSELEKQFEPVKRGRRIKRDDIKLQVNTNKGVE